MLPYYVFTASLRIQVSSGPSGTSEMSRCIAATFEPMKRAFIRSISSANHVAASVMILTIVVSISCATSFSCGVLNMASRVVGFSVARIVLPPSS